MNNITFYKINTFTDMRKRTTTNQRYEILDQHENLLNPQKYSSGSYHAEKEIEQGNYKYKSIGTPNQTLTKNAINLQLKGKNISITQNDHDRSHIGYINILTPNPLQTFNDLSHFF